VKLPGRHDKEPGIVVGHRTATADTAQLGNALNGSCTVPESGNQV
jgi:hypothetical protein